MEKFNKLGIHKKDIRFIKNAEKNSFISKYDVGQLTIQNFDQLSNIVHNIYEETKIDNKGNVADYIPQLKNVDDNKFGIIIVTIDGQVIEIGDNDSKFCIQSCSKPINYGIALEKLGENIVHNYVGKEPSGRNFNELCLNEDNLPHNPLINSGAIMTTSLIDFNKTTSERFDNIYNYWKKITLNSHLSFNNSVYLSEKDSADRNYCLGYMMQEKNAFLGKNSKISKDMNRNWKLNDLKINLELYFQLCSIESDLLGIGLLASTLANGGIHPWSNEVIFKSETIKKMLSIMSSCGMYDYSGEWNYNIGIPAKSGVSGLIYGIIPGICGIVTYSPKLDKLGNSYRGIQFFTNLINKINFHNYETINNKKLISIKRVDNTHKKILGFLLLDGCYNNNIDIVKECLSKGCDINFKDYDNRTALHIATEENNKDIIDYLISNGADTKIKDRWDKTVEDLKSSNIQKQ